MKWIITGSFEQGQNGRGYGDDTPPTLKNFHFAGQKQQYSVFLQGNLLDPGPASEHIPR